MSTQPPQDALDLLDADHQAVKKMFVAYRELAANDAPEARRKALADQICMELTIHARLEEELFYPLVREAIRDDDLMDEAEVEHASAKDLIVQILSMDAHEELYDAKVTVLGEYIDHHVKEERTEMFPKARAARKLDLVAMRGPLEARKEELMAEMETAMS